MNFKNSSLKKFFIAFIPAFKGLGLAFKSERNIRFQFIVVICVVVFSFAFNLALIEWLFILILFALVIALELINTAIENLCNAIQPEKDERIRIIKDISAGAVLWVSIIALITGLLIFVPKIFHLLNPKV